RTLGAGVAVGAARRGVGRLSGAVVAGGRARDGVGARVGRGVSSSDGTYLVGVGSGGGAAGTGAHAAARMSTTPRHHARRTAKIIRPGWLRGWFSTPHAAACTGCMSITWHHADCAVDFEHGHLHRTQVRDAVLP